MNAVVAGIVTYNPDLIRLKDNISAVELQVERVIVVDNGSTNIGAIDNLCKEHKAELLCNSENLGIAKALNQLFEYTRSIFGEDSYILTLDQDSVVYPDIIELYSKYVDFDRVASITSLREDRNYSATDYSNQTEYSYASKCITSGNLVKLSAWEKIGGFDERLFIDMVDSEFCYRLRLSGYNILQINKVEFVHELGDAFIVKFLGKKRTILNHSAFRKYYIFRNTIYLLRKYRIARKDYNCLELIKALFCIWFFEKDKLKKTKRSFMGIIDGFRMR